MVTIIDMTMFTIIDGNGVRRWSDYRWRRLPVSRIGVPFPVISRWWNGERASDLAQTPFDHRTSFCVEPQPTCSRSRATVSETLTASESHKERASGGPPI